MSEAKTYPFAGDKNPATKSFVVRAVSLISDAILARLQRDADRIAALEARIVALESRPALKYCGTWAADRQSNEGEFFTHKGNLWHCNRATRAEPGTTADFVLAVRRGRDARDAR